MIKQLEPKPQYMYMYLDSLFDKDPQFALPYSDRLVELYAEYDPERLMPFLRASNFYDLEKALHICRERDYVPEMVFLLGRMGNNKQALMLIIERLGDVQRVSALATSESDASLTPCARQSTLQKNKPMKIFGKICCNTRKPDPTLFVRCSNMSVQRSTRSV